MPDHHLTASSYFLGSDSAKACMMLPFSIIGSRAFGCALSKASTCARASGYFFSSRSRPMSCERTRVIAFAATLANAGSDCSRSMIAWNWSRAFFWKSSRGLSVRDWLISKLLSARKTRPAKSYCLRSLSFSNSLTRASLLLVSLSLALLMRPSSLLSSAAMSSAAPFFHSPLIILANSISTPLTGGMSSPPVTRMLPTSIESLTLPSAA